MSHNNQAEVGKNLIFLLWSMLECNYLPASKIPLLLPTGKLYRLNCDLQLGHCVGTFD